MEKSKVLIIVPYVFEIKSPLALDRNFICLKGGYLDAKFRSRS